MKRISFLKIIIILQSYYVVVLCCYVLMARHTCTTVQCTAAEVLTDPQSESGRGEDQNIVSPISQNTADRSDNDGGLVANNVSIRIILIHLQTLHHHELCLAACLPCLRYGFNINNIFRFYLQLFYISIVV